MILKFPDTDSLSLCLASGVVAEEIANQESKFAIDSMGRVWLEFKTSVSRGPLKEIKQLGVETSRSWKECDVDTTQIAHWWEAIPVERLPRVEVTERASVIFDLAQPEQLPELVNEILRQGNDRLSLRVLADDSLPSGTRTLLKVIGPPYFTLLRAVSEATSESPQILRAFVESPARVWTEVGCHHPFASNFQPAIGQHLFIDSVSQWSYLKEAPYRDLYSVLEYQLPHGPEHAVEGELTERLEIPLRLLRGSSPDESPELWVLSGDGVQTLETFVRNSSDGVLQRLSFAVVEINGAESVLVRIRPSRLTPPVLPFDGIGVPYRNILRINNLFVPMGRKVHPPLRRDAIRTALAPTDSDIVWLEPHDKDGFVPRSIADRVFQPLTEWVDYVLDQHHESLTAWSRSAQFDFQSFVCADGAPELPKGKRKRNEKDDREKSARIKQDDKDKQAVDQLTITEQKPKAKKKAPKKLKQAEDDSDLARQQLEEQLKSAEQEFFALEEPLDSKARFEMWDELATINTSLKRHTEAGICRIHRLWEDTSIDAADVRNWLQSIIRSATRKYAITDADNKITQAQIETLLKKNNPVPVEVAQLAAWIVWQGSTEQPAKFMRSVIGDLQQFIESNELYLSVRTTWLTWSSLAKLTGGDTLLLARSRDRVLERLYQHGLASDLEMPSFLRVAGSPSSDRFRQVKDRFITLHESIKKWSKVNLGLANVTTYAYVDLIYAYGLARLGESTMANTLLDNASKALSGKQKDDIHHWLRSAYKHRIREAIDGTSTTKALPDELVEYLEGMSKLDKYKVDRLRQHSNIIEPHEKMDPYHAWRRRAEGDLEQSLAKLFDENDAGKLLKQLKTLFQKTSGPDDHARVLATALELSPRLGEKQATSWLSEVDGALQKISDPILTATLLERGMSIAAHYGQNLEATRLFQQLRKLIASQKKADLKTLAAIEAMLSQSFRVLRRLGMRDEMAQLLEDLSSLVQTGTKAKKNDPERLKLLLQLAGGWFYFGNDNGWPDIDYVRDLLFKETFSKEGHVGSMKQADLAMAYVSAVGQAPLKDAIARLEDLFTHLGGIHDSNTVNSHYSLKQVDLVEALVQTVVSDDFTVDKSTLRWLDEEEFLIRRRIHADMQHAMDE